MQLRNEEKQIDAELLEANELSSSLQREIEDVERRIAAHLDFEQSIDKAFVSVYVLTSSSFSTQHLYDCIALQWYEWVFVAIWIVLINLLAILDQVKAEISFPCTFGANC